MLITFVLFLILWAEALAAPNKPARFWRHRRSDSSTLYLGAHNAVREEYHVPPLGWSDDLAKLAQTWADTCQFKHSGGSLSRTPYGENIEAATGSFPISTAMGLFSSDAERKEAHHPVSPIFNHFTQVVWRSTEVLGCAYSECHGIFNSTRDLATVYVCLYEPAGNVVGQEKENVPV